MEVDQQNDSPEQGGEPAAAANAEEEEVKPTLEDYLADREIQEYFKNPQLWNILNEVEKEPTTLETHLANPVLRNTIFRIYKFTEPHLPPRPQQSRQARGGLPGMGMEIPNFGISGGAGQIDIMNQGGGGAGFEPGEPPNTDMGQLLQILSQTAMNDRNLNR